MSTAALTLRTPVLAANASRSATLAAAFDRCSSSLYRYLAVRAGDSHVADDLMQQLWLATLRAADVPEAELEFWLRGTAKNLLRAHWRRTARRPDSAAIGDTTVAAELAQRLDRELLPDELLNRRETRDQLLLAITALPHEQQQLIAAHYFDQRSQLQIADSLGVSERAVEGRLYRARAALRDALQHLEID